MVEKMKQEYSVKCGLLTDQEVKFIEGYMWGSDSKTKKAFFKQTKNDLGKFKKGAICLDLYKGQDLEGTITISKKDFNELRNN